MDFKQPIDIIAVMTAVKKYKKELQSVDRLSASEVLQHMTPISGVTDSIELGKVEGGTVSSKYTGTFKAGKYLGKIVPRRLIVRSVVMEMDDEPERYRRTYITEVPGGILQRHPFELWLINHGISLASEDLLNAMMTARYSADPEKTEITDSFDGLGTVIEDAKKVGDISSLEGNLFTTGELTRANIGDKLLEMWRRMPKTFKRKKNIKMFLSSDLGDMYDDWRKDEGTIIIGGTEETDGTKYLLGSQKKCEIVRLPNMPEGSQMVILTTKENVCYGFDKYGDFSSIRPFFKDPYHFTASGKYVIGFQLQSVHKSEFCVNERPLDPEAEDVMGYIKVGITPDEAVNNGARWRIVGENGWRESGTFVAVKPGEYKVEYSPAAGYTAPEESTQNPTAGNVSEVTGTYTLAGA